MNLEPHVQIQCGETENVIAVNPNLGDTDFAAVGTKVLPIPAVVSEDVLK